MIEIVNSIPVIDDGGVFSLMQFADVVKSVEELRVDGLLQKIHQISLHKNEPKWLFRADIDAWILRYCAHSLATLGYSGELVSIQAKEASK